MKNKSAIRAFSALAHDSRLKLFRLLVKRGPKGMIAGEIAKAVGISATALSFHVKELERAGLLTSSREGRYVHYAVNVDGIRELLTFLMEDCCEGRPELCGPAIAGIDDVFGGKSRNKK